MLNLPKTRQALEAKKLELLQSHGQAHMVWAQIQLGLRSLSAHSCAALLAKLADCPWPGALPTLEHDAFPSQVVPFEHSFQNHEEARAWARSVLEGFPTVAVDGSQVVPPSELLLPIGLAQAAWYRNPHDPTRVHEKDLVVEVLAGTDFGSLEGEAASTHVETRRFQMEVEALISMINEAEAGARPVCFFDGPLVVSFASQYAAQRRGIYVSAVSALLEAAESRRVPVVGYVAGSAASDCVHMLAALGFVQAAGGVTDSALFAPLLRHWGDRSVCYICARDDGVLNTYRRQDGSSLARSIAFCYLRTGQMGPPARLEFPSWLLEDRAELERVLAVVRAECIVGLGYPYPLEVADQAAALSSADRELFLRLVEDFAKEIGLGVEYSEKARSKRRRR
jgi:hypothetical protein